MANKKIIWLVLAALVLLTVLAFLFRDNSPRFDWRETYRFDSMEPYGTFVVNELLRESAAAYDFHLLRDSIHGALPSDVDTLSNFVFIGEAMMLDSTDLYTLLDFVALGNKAFISSKTIPTELMEELYYYACYDYWDDYWYFTDSIALLNFYEAPLQRDSAFKFLFLRRNLPRNYDWHYMDRSYFCEEEGAPVPLGHYPDSLINYARFDYGDGSFLLHTTPLLFTNIQLLDDKGVAYADRTFTYLHEGPVYWDAYSHVSEQLGRQHNNSNYGNRKLSGDSPLQYILSQPPLAWAWYLLLAMSILYLIFRSKRKQRIVPVLAPNTNTSLEFLSTIGRLHFLQNNHKQLLQQKMRLLLAFIRERYHLQTKELNATFVEKLATRSEISAEHLNKILLMHRNIEQSNFVSDKTFIDFHQLVDHFYKNCK